MPLRAHLACTATENEASLSLGDPGRRDQEATGSSGGEEREVESGGEDPCPPETGGAGGQGASIGR